MVGGPGIYRKPGEHEILELDFYLCPEAPEIHHDGPAPELHLAVDYRCYCVVVLSVGNRIERRPRADGKVEFPGNRPDEREDRGKREDALLDEIVDRLVGNCI